MRLASTGWSVARNEWIAAELVGKGRRGERSGEFTTQASAEDRWAAVVVVVGPAFVIFSLLLWRLSPPFLGQDHHSSRCPDLRDARSEVAAKEKATPKSGPSP